MYYLLSNFIEIKIRQACYPVAAKNANGIMNSKVFIFILQKKTLSISTKYIKHHEKLKKNQNYKNRFIFK